MSDKQLDFSQESSLIAFLDLSNMFHWQDTLKSSTLNLFDHNAHGKLDELILYLQKQGIEIEEPKCNFDVEMALDMLDAIDKVSGVLLFSGDSDMREPLERLRLKDKRIYVFGVRGQVGKELWPVMTRFCDFGRWYAGVRKRKTRS